MAKAKPQLRVRKKAPAPRKRKPAQRRGAMELPLARLLNDPCGSPLVAPQYGASSGGYLSKLSRYDVLNMDVGGNGFLIWFPDYTGRNTGGGAPSNVFVYQSTGLGQPTNTSAAPLGAGSTNSADANGFTLADPAYNFVFGTTVQDTRTIASCIKMIYTGRNDSLSGRVGVVTGISRDSLLSGGGDQPPTIAELFNYATHAARTPMDEVEVKSRPSEGSEFYRNVRNVEDVAFTVGTTGTSATTIGAGSPGGVGMGIGFVWSGLDSSSSLTFDFLKAIEWRPEFNNQLAMPSESVAPAGGNLVSRAVAWLDARYPGWQHTLLNRGVSGMARIAETAFTGPQNAAQRAAMTALPMLLG